MVIIRGMQEPSIGELGDVPLRLAVADLESAGDPVGEGAASERVPGHCGDGEGYPLRL
jgi:hypothetical protein